MERYTHTILCVDDEKSILNSLKRLLHKEKYQIFLAESAEEGLEILNQNKIDLVISDHRMPGMKGTDFLAKVFESYPDTIRMILTGYTEVDTIAESINKGYIYKFFFKPWHDNDLKLGIRKALDYHDLIKTNEELSAKVLEQMEELKMVNAGLEEKVKERTRQLEIRNQALELSRSVLEEVPFPIMGISQEGTLVLMNKAAMELSFNSRRFELGSPISEYLPRKIEKAVKTVLIENKPKFFPRYEISGACYDLLLNPLVGRFTGKGVILSMETHPCQKNGENPT